MTISSMQKLLEGFDSLNNNEEIKEDYEEDVIHILGPIFTSLWEKEMLEEKRYKKRKNLIDKRKKSVIIKHVLKIPKQLYLHNTQLEGG